MEINQEIREKLNLPNISQIGIVVKDIDNSIEYYERILGFGPFVRPEISYDEEFYYGKLRRLVKNLLREMMLSAQV